MTRWIGLVVLAAGVALAAQRFVEAPSVLCLNDNAAMALLVDGRAALTVKQGNVQVNSTHIHALFMGVEGELVAERGEIACCGGMAWHGRRIDPAPVLGTHVENPYHFLKIPAIDEVRSQQRVWLDGDAPITLRPGVYYEGMTIGGGCTVTFEPGIYAFVDGDLWIQNGCKIDGQGVTILMAGDRPGQMTVGHETVMELSAPTDGPLQGVVFGHTGRDKSTIFWGGEVKLKGLIYVPTSDWQVLNTAKVEVGAVVCNTMKVSNGGKLTVTGEFRVPVPKETDREGDGAGR